MSADAREGPLAAIREAEAVARARIEQARKRASERLTRARADAATDRTERLAALERELDRARERARAEADADARRERSRTDERAATIEAARIDEAFAAMVAAVLPGAKREGPCSSP